MYARRNLRVHNTRVYLNTLIVAGISIVGFGLGLFTAISISADEKFNGSTKNQDHNFPATAWDYAQLVEPILGVPPRVDLGRAIEMPLYVDGKQVHGVFDQCDNPSRLGKGCVSGSVVQRYLGQRADGSEIPDVVWVAFGRSSEQLKIGITGSVQMIGYHRVTGATAFFESSDAIDPWAYLDEESQRLKGVMPWIDNPEEFNQAFRTPGTTQCVSCHQNDPFIHNSFIDSAKDPETGRPVVPVVRTRDMDFESELPYYVIGGEDWDMRTIYIDRNECLGCHRIGMSTLNMFMQSGWNPHEEMPPGRPGKYRDDFEELMECWNNTPEKTVNCDWIIPPANSNLGRIVGDDYAFKADFNDVTLSVSKGAGEIDIKHKLRELKAELEQTEHKERNGSITPEAAAKQRKELEYWIEILELHSFGSVEKTMDLPTKKKLEEKTFFQ